MTTFVDAFALGIGLDPSRFKKGMGEVSAATKKTRESAEKEGARIEKSLDKAGESLERLARNALKLFAIFTAGRAVKDFVTDITGADAALGRLAKSLETTPEALSSLGNAVARSGGSADAAIGSFQKLTSAYNEVRLTGRSATYDMLARLQGASGQVIRFGKDATKTIYDTADAAKALSEKAGVSFTTHLLEQAGLDPGTIALLLQGSGKVKEAYEKVRRLGGVVTQKDTDAAQRFSTALTDVRTISEGLGRTIWTSLSPALSEIIEKFIKWYEVNGEWLRNEISEKVKAFADYIRSIDWESIGKGILEFVHGANDAAKAVGGWKVVFEALLGAWLFTKLFSLLRMLGLIRLAIAGAAVPGILGSLMAALGLAAVGSGLVAANQMPKVLEKEGAAGLDPATGGATDRSTMDSRGHEGWGRKYIRRGWNGVKRFFGGGSAEAHEGGGTPTGSSAGSLTKVIEEAAKAAGIDPRYMHGIRAGESNRNNSYDVKSDGREDSYGPFQLNRRGGLGARFEKETGLDLHDPKTIPAQAKWVAEYLKKRLAADPNYNPGSEWFGYKGLQNANPKWGDSGYVPSDGRRAEGNTPPSSGVGGVEQTQTQPGHTRSQRITETLNNQLAKAAQEAGVNVQVYSGGQPSEGGNRKGTHRHDDGRSADLRLYTTTPDGKRRYLDMRNEADRAVMEKFLRSSVKHGATGIGAGPGYMGGSTNMHVGGGLPAIAWGAGGSSATAPDWVRRAHREGMADRAEAARKQAEQRVVDAAKAASKPATPPPASPRPEDQPVQHEPTAYERWKAKRDAGKPKAALDAVRTGALAAVANLNATQEAVAARTMNDNRSSRDNRSYEETHLHGPININTPATDGRSIMAELRAASKGGKSFAAAADYGKV